MKKYGLVVSIILILFLQPHLFGQVTGVAVENTPTYKVKSLRKPLKINGDWDKSQWRKVKAVEVNNFILAKPGFTPDVKAKMMYDEENLYVIFSVKDKFVRSITTEINGPVWTDSAVEFFFSPNTNKPASYFNLEVNCGGTPLLGYNSTPRAKPTVEDIKKIEIAHSLPKTVDPEIAGPVTWTIEYRFPLDILQNYTEVTKPAKGVKWRANFYKIAENSTNPHYLSWSPISHPKPSFHLPQFFGVLEFQ